MVAGCGDSGDQVDPEALSSEELVLKARMRINQKQGQAALIELKRAVQVDEANPEARFLLGRLYFESQEMTSAEKQLQLAIELGYDMS